MKYTENSQKYAFGVDFDNVIALTSLLKARYITDRFPNWQDLLARAYSEDLMVATGMARKDAVKEGRRYAERFKAIPPWYTNKLLCVRVIGEKSYEEMSHEIQMNLTKQAPLIRGIRESLDALVDRGLQPALVTDRREEGMKSAEEWLHQHGMYDLFRGEFHRTEGQDKIAYCKAQDMRAHTDDDPRFLVEYPKVFTRENYFLKLLEAVGRSQHSDFTITRVKTNGQERVIHVMQLVEQENIKYVTGFPKAAEAIIAHAAQAFR